MFNLGGISAVTGTISPLVWTCSVLLGFMELFIYAEIAGLHPSKSGGTAVHGATAWVRYSKIIAPMSIWSNWLAWSPILAIGSGLASGYLLSIFVPPDHPINTWQITLLNLNSIQPDLTVRINAQFIIGTIIMLAIWSVQHTGIGRTARAAVLLTVASLNSAPLRNNYSDLYGSYRLEQLHSVCPAQWLPGISQVGVSSSEA